MELFTPGCLGTCWYGKYHYMEPFIGCAHNCLYCYARFRRNVSAAVREKESDFSKPVLAMEKAALLEEIRKQTADGKIEIVKLCRFTDIFTPPFDADGTSFEILRALAQSPVKRIIITTKGVASPQVLKLIAQYPGKFSYNAVAKPIGEFRLEQGPENTRARLEAAAQAKKAGALVTVHMDPVLVGVEDTPELLGPFFDGLKKLGLNRVMFSYLLVNAEIAALIKQNLPAKQANALLARYQQQEIQILPAQDDTAYANLLPELKTESVKRISALLAERGFEYVLCSLKSGKDGVKAGTGCPMCDGKFYA